jgi:hypothetical protein
MRGAFVDQGGLFSYRLFGRRDDDWVGRRNNNRLWRHACSDCRPAESGFSETARDRIDAPIPVGWCRSTGSSGGRQTADGRHRA